MELVTKKKAYWGTLLIPHNMRFTVPDDIGIGLTSRGMAEEISPDILAKEREAELTKVAEVVTPLKEFPTEQEPEKKKGKK